MHNVQFAVGPDSVLQLFGDHGLIQPDSRRNVRIAGVRADADKVRSLFENIGRLLFVIRSQGRNGEGDLRYLLLPGRKDLRLGKARKDLIRLVQLPLGL